MKQKQMRKRKRKKSSYSRKSSVKSPPKPFSLGAPLGNNFKNPMFNLKVEPHATFGNGRPRPITSRTPNPFMISPMGSKDPLKVNYTRNNLMGMNWKQAKKKYPSMNPLGDVDLDGTLNFKDCKPFDPSQDGIFGAIAGAVKGAFGGKSEGQSRWQSVKEKASSGWKEDSWDRRAVEKTKDIFTRKKREREVRDDLDRKKEVRDMLRAKVRKEQEKFYDEYAVKSVMKGEGVSKEEAERLLRMKRMSASDEKVMAGALRGRPKKTDFELRKEISKVTKAQEALDRKQSREDSYDKFALASVMKGTPKVSRYEAKKSIGEVTKQEAIEAYKPKVGIKKVPAVPKTIEKKTMVTDKGFLVMTPQGKVQTKTTQIENPELRETTKVGKVLSATGLSKVMGSKLDTPSFKQRKEDEVVSGKVYDALMSPGSKLGPLDKFNLAKAGRPKIVQSRLEIEKSEEDKKTKKARAKKQEKRVAEDFADDKLFSKGRPYTKTDVERKAKEDLRKQSLGRFGTKLEGAGRWFETKAIGKSSQREVVGKDGKVKKITTWRGGLGYGARDKAGKVISSLAKSRKDTGLLQKKGKSGVYTLGGGLVYHSSLGRKLTKARNTSTARRMTTVGRRPRGPGRPPETFKIRPHPLTGKPVAIPAQEYYKLQRKAKSLRESVATRAKQKALTGLAQQGVPPQLGRRLLQSREEKIRGMTMKPVPKVQVMEPIENTESQDLPREERDMERQ